MTSKLMNNPHAEADRPTPSESLWKRASEPSKSGSRSALRSARGVRERAPSLDIVILGLSITSSWGNGHATTFRGLVRELTRRGHRTLFLERDMPWYAENRDMPNPPFGRTEIYRSVDELKRRFSAEVRKADVVIVGSYVPEGIAVGQWVCDTAGGLTGFYDIDTPVTLAKLAAGKAEYLTPNLVRRYGLYLSFTGGPTLETIEDCYGSPAARPMYCSVDPELYYPEPRRARWDMGYLGTYSTDRQPTVDRLLTEPAKRWPDGNFLVVGPQYPEGLTWPKNVKRIIHLPPAKHRRFYNSQRFTLNVTRADMIKAGYSPSVRLFEAAACGVPIISDYWDGLETFFELNSEILVARSTEEVVRMLRETSEAERQRIAAAARERVMAHHTAAHRAAELEGYILELAAR
jgi:spore maturation protein CgeB